MLQQNNTYGVQIFLLVLSSVRDQKAAGSNPATSTSPESFENQGSPDFFAFWKMWIFSGKGCENWEKFTKEKARSR